MEDLGFGKGGGVPLPRMFSTVFVRAHEAGDTCAQNDKKGGSSQPKNPPGSATAEYTRYYDHYDVDGYENNNLERG